MHGNSPGVLIVDDEPQSRLLIRKLLEQYPSIGLVFEAGSVSEADQILKMHSPRLLFLDVQLRNETAFDLLECIGDVQVSIIFTTAFSEYAVRAFRFNAIDYLTKPIDPEEFDQAMTRALHDMQHPVNGADGRYLHLGEQILSGNAIPNKLTIPTTEGYLFVGTGDILYCRADGNYTEFQLAGNQKILSSYTLGHYDELLSGQSFFRIHRSYLINLAHVKMYKKGDGGTVVMQDGVEIEVSRGNKDAFIKLFKG